MDEIGRFKKSCRCDVPMKQLFGGCPREYIDIMRTIDGGRFFDEPDYPRVCNFIEFIYYQFYILSFFQIYNLLRAAMRSMNGTEFPYDWERWEEEKKRREEADKKKAEAAEKGAADAKGGPPQKDDKKKGEAAEKDADGGKAAPQKDEKKKADNHEEKTGIVEEKTHNKEDKEDKDKHDKKAEKKEKVCSYLCNLNTKYFLEVIVIQSSAFNY